MVLRAVSSILPPQPAIPFDYAYEGYPFKLNHSEGGLTYQLQSRADLRAGAWTNVGGNVTASSPVTVQGDTNGSLGPRFYRLLLGAAMPD